VGGPADHRDGLTSGSAVGWGRRLCAPTATRRGACRASGSAGRRAPVPAGRRRTRRGACRASRASACRASAARQCLPGVGAHGGVSAHMSWRVRSGGPVCEDIGAGGPVCEDIGAGHTGRGLRRGRATPGVVREASAHTAGCLRTCRGVCAVAARCARTSRPVFCASRPRPRWRGQPPMSGADVVSAPQTPARAARPRSRMCPVRTMSGEPPAGPIPQPVLAQLLGDDDVGGGLPRPQEPAVLRAAVELADGAQRRPAEVNASDEPAGNPQDCPLRGGGLEPGPVDRHPAARLPDTFTPPVRECHHPASCGVPASVGRSLESCVQLRWCDQIVVQSSIGDHHSLLEGDQPRDVHHRAGDACHSFAVKQHNLVGFPWGSVHV